MEQKKTVEKNEVVPSIMLHFCTTPGAFQD
jgi:hypothetical protein